MTSTALRLVALGPAPTLTRDGLGAEFIEMNIRNGKWPTVG